MRYQDIFIEPVSFSTEEIEQAAKGNYRPASARLREFVAALNRRNAAKRASGERTAKKAAVPRPKAGRP